MPTLELNPHVCIPTVFLDRDGVINRNLTGENPYVTNWSQFEFLTGVLEGIRLLSQLSKHLIVVTNQRGIARHLMTETDLLKIHTRMQSEITACGGRLDGVYHCPHDRDMCQCRKPAKGLFEQARNDFPDINYSQSVVVGDSSSDLQAARAIGAKSVLINTRTDWQNILQKCRGGHSDKTRVYSSLKTFSIAVQSGHYTL